MLNRTVFDKILTDGFKTSKVESIAVGSNGKRMFVGTSDGNLLAYDFQTSLSSYSKINCNIFSTIRNQPKDKKPVSNLIIAESWNVFVAIVDGVVTTFDLQSFQPKSVLPDTKGCTMFSLHEYNGVIAVANKRKVSLYAWAQPNAKNASGFYLRKEMSGLPESPRNIVCITNGVIVAYKKSYEAIDLITFSSLKVMDVDKDQRLHILELPSNELRSAAVLLSHGVQGLLFDAFKVMSKSSSVLFDNRLEWSSAPVSVHLLSPFIVTILSDSLEIHDIASLCSLQRVPLPSTSPTSAFSSSSTTYSFSACEIDPLHGLEYGYVSAGDQIVVLRMTPLSSQIKNLMESNRFEEAINLCILCQNNPQLKDIDVSFVHEKFAMALYQRGDFDGAITNFIKGKSTLARVFGLFPDLVPNVFHNFLGINVNSATYNPKAMTKMSGAILFRAASALVTFCEHQRIEMKDSIVLAEKYRASTSNITSALENLEGIVVSDWEDVLKRAEVVDTVLLYSLVNCMPPRRSAVIDLLSYLPSRNQTFGNSTTSLSVNRCHLDSSASLLVSQGISFSEALLWLYRSHDEHRRVLGALTEDRCVGVNSWTRDQFFYWTSEYLGTLWFHDDASLPILALNALRPVLEFNADLGLSILTNRPTIEGTNKLSDNIGGKGTEIQDVLSFLDSVRPDPKISSSAKSSAFNPNEYDRNGKYNPALLRIPLTSGRALSLTYLEWRVYNCPLSPNTHDEFANMLVEGMNLNAVSDHKTISTDFDPSDSEEVLIYKMYRKKLQYFLETSNEYHPDKVLKFLPSDFLLEYALVISRLGRHQEVLDIYISQIQNIKSAEFYCNRIYQMIPNAKQNQVNTSLNNVTRIVNRVTPVIGQDIESMQKIYLMLIKTLLADSKKQKSNNTVIQNLDVIMNIAEKYYDRINPLDFLQVLPDSVPMSALSKYLQVVLEYSNSNKRNLQVIHQLLRIREVNIRTQNL